MPAFVTKGAASVAAIAAALSLATPLAAQEAAPAWHVERFGVGMEIPGDLYIDEDRHNRDRMEFSAVREGEDRVDIRMGVRVMTPAAISELTLQPGEVGFAGVLSEIANIPLERTDITMQIGGAEFRAFAGTGTRAAADGSEEHTRSLFLITEEPLPSGDGLWIAVLSGGLTPDEAQRVEADFVSSLTLDAAEAGSLAPLALLDGLVRLTPPAESDLAARRRSRREMVQTGAVGAESPDTLLTAELLRDPLDEVTRMAEIRLLQLDAVTQGIRDGVPVWVLEGSGQPLADGSRAEDGVGQPTRMEVTALCPPGEGPVVLGATVAAGPVDPALLDGVDLMLPDDAASCGGPLNTAIGTLVETYGPALVEGVDIAEDIPETPAPEAAPADGAPEAGDVAQAPEAEAPEAAAPEIAAPEAPAETAEVTPPEAPAEDPADAAPEATTPEDAAPAALALAEPDGSVPEGWVTHTRFGITMAAPAEAAIDSDRATSDRMEFLLEHADFAAHQSYSIGAMIAPPERVADMPAPGTPEFVELVAGWSGMEVERTGDTVTLGDTVLNVYSGIGQRRAGGEDRDGRVVYLIAETPLPNGNTPFLVAAAVGYEDDAARAMIADMVRGLSVADAGDWGRVTAVPLLDGLGRFAVPRILSVMDVDSSERETNIALGDGETIMVMIVAEQVTREMDAWFADRLVRVDRASVATVAGEAAQVAEGLAAFRPDFRRPEEGEEVLGRVVVLDRCLPDGARIALSAVSNAEWASQDALFSFLNGVALDMPEGAATCEAAFTPLAAAPADEAPGAEVAATGIPADWVQIEAYGLTLFTPPGMSVEDMQTGRSTAEMFLSGLDMQTMTGTQIGIRIQNADAIVESSGRDPASTDWQALFSQVSGVSMTRTETRAVLDDGTELVEFRGAGPIQMNGQTVEARISFLASETADANGLFTWVGIADFGGSADQAETIVTAVAAGLGGAATVPDIVLAPAAPEAPAQPEAPPAEVAVPETPQAELRPPQPPSGVVITPGQGGSKDPTPPAMAADPEADAWARAEAAQSAEAMIAYLLEWPAGAHAEEARSWLMARAIMPPEPAPSAPLQPPAAAMPSMDPEQAAWQRVLDEGTPAALWTYLKAFPDGANVAQARAMLSGAAPAPQAPAAPPGRDPEPAPQLGK